MPRGDKSAYTEKQKRQAEHIEKGYEKRGVSEEEAEKRAWATVNKMTGGGKKSGSGRGHSVNKAPAKKGSKDRGGCDSYPVSRQTFSKRKKSSEESPSTSKSSQYEENRSYKL